MPQPGTLTESERAALRDAIATNGTVTVAKWIGCGRDVLGRAVAGLPVRRGTIVLIRSRILRATKATPDIGGTRGELARELDLLRGLIDFARTHLERGNDEAVREAVADAHGHLATIARLAGRPGGPDVG